MSEAPLAIQMLHDRILIKMTGGAGERTTRAGILIPATTFLRYEQPAYATVDVSIGASKGQWNAQLFSNNLNNSHASTFTSTAQFIRSDVPLRPRVMGLRVGYDF